MPNDLLQDLMINEEDLEHEWLLQPSLYMQYAEFHAQTIKARDMAKMKVEYIFAELFLKLKSDWEKYFDNKPTEGMVKAKIEVNKRYRDAVLEHIEAVTEANHYQNAKNSFEHRKKALENIVSLRITGFHSEPRNKLRRMEDHKVQKEMLNKGTRVTSRKTIKRKRKQ